MGSHRGCGPFSRRRTRLGTPRPHGVQSCAIRCRQPRGTPDLYPCRAGRDLPSHPDGFLFALPRRNRHALLGSLRSQPRACRYRDQSPRATAGCQDPLLGRRTCYRGSGHHQELEPSLSGVFERGCCNSGRGGARDPPNQGTAAVYSSCERYAPGPCSLALLQGGGHARPCPNNPYRRDLVPLRFFLTLCVERLFRAPPTTPIPVNSAAIDGCCIQADR